MDAETPQNGNVPSAKPAKQQKRRHSYKQIFNGFHHQQKTKKKQRKVTQSNAAKVWVVLWIESSSITNLILMNRELPS